MATGSVSITITVPSINGAGGANAPAASEVLACYLIQQAAQQIGASGATAGNIYYPAGTSVGTWTYSAAT